MKWNIRVKNKGFKITNSKMLCPFKLVLGVEIKIYSLVQNILGNKRIQSKIEGTSTLKLIAHREIWLQFFPHFCKIVSNYVPTSPRFVIRLITRAHFRSKVFSLNQKSRIEKNYSGKIWYGYMILHYFSKTFDTYVDPGSILIYKWKIHGPELPCVYCS